MLAAFIDRKRRIKAEHGNASAFPDGQGKDPEPKSRPLPRKPRRNPDAADHERTFTVFKQCGGRSFSVQFRKDRHIKIPAIAQQGQKRKSFGQNIFKAFRILAKSREKCFGISGKRMPEASGNNQSLQGFFVSKRKGSDSGVAEGFAGREEHAQILRNGYISAVQFPYVAVKAERAEAVCHVGNNAAQPHLLKHFRAISRERRQFREVGKAFLGRISARVVRGDHEHIVHAVHLHALVKDLEIMGQRNAFIADKHSRVALRVHIKDMLNAQSVLAVVLETEKRQEYPGRQAGAVIFRVLIPPLKIKTGQQKTE